TFLAVQPALGADLKALSGALDKELSELQKKLPGEVQVVRRFPKALRGLVDSALSRLQAGLPPDRTLEVTEAEEVGTLLRVRQGDMVVALSGPDLQVLADESEKLAATLAKIEGLSRSRVAPQMRRAPVPEIEVDRKKARALGVTVTDVVRVLP